MKKILITIVLLITIISLTPAQNENVALIQDKKVPKAPNLPWPIDKDKGLHNFAQEMIFNKDKLNEYLELARAYYIAGYNGLNVYLGDETFKVFKQITGVKIYEVDHSKGDLYLQDPYKIEIFTTSGLSVLKDFIEAEWCYNETMNILKYIGQWDRTITTKGLYKELVDNTYKSLIYCSVYVNNYKVAWKYISEYKKISKDEKFIIEWETRILGVLVGIAKKYDWALTGAESYRKRKEQHRDVLLRAIDFYYPGESDLKKELKKNIYPEFVYEPPSSATNK